MKLIVAGSRSFYNYKLMREKLDFYLQNVKEEIEIVSGMARGADTLGERYADEKGYPVKHFPAEWFKHRGASAGYLRNLQMAEYATHCVCFWDGSSPGTRMMIRIAKEKKLPCKVVKY
jgi:hypothetical protein